jgi:hypothetical protein
VSSWSTSEGLAPRLAVLRGPHASCRPSDTQNRPAWLERSVASPPLRCAHRPVPFVAVREKGTRSWSSWGSMPTHAHPHGGGDLKGRAQAPGRRRRG